MESVVELLDGFENKTVALVKGDDSGFFVIFGVEKEESEIGFGVEDRL